MAMIRTIPQILPKPVVAELLAELQTQQLSAGSETAGTSGQDLKNNLQLLDTPEALAMSQRINGFMNERRNLTELLALRSSLPFMFNCYRPGMEYKPHRDNVIMY